MFEALKQKYTCLTETFGAIVEHIILYACESWGNDISGSINSIDSIFKDSFEKLHYKNM